MSYQRPRRRLGILRAFLLGLTVFVVTAFAGALLAGGAERPREPSAATEVTALSDRRSAATDRRHDLGRTLISSGAAGLVVAVTGFVVVARRRRLW